MARRSTPSVSIAAERYIAHTYGKGGSAGMRYSLRSLLSRLARSVNDRQVGNLTPEDFESFFYGPGGLAESCARSTLGKYRGDLLGFLKWANRRAWCDDPNRLLGGITHTSTRVGRNRLRLAEADMWRMIETAPNPRDAALLAFAMHTGCRVSEILDTKIRDLNLTLGEVRLRIIKTHDEDTMRVSPALERYLRAWLTHYAEHAPGPDDYLFPAACRARFVKRGEPLPWQERGFAPGRKITNPRLIIQRMADLAGVTLEKGDGWHTIRRSVARIFFDRASHLGHDAALRMTSAFLHHKNTQTTEIYLGLELEKVKRDAVMSEGFLTEPSRENVTSLGDYREGTNG